MNASVAKRPNQLLRLAIFNQCYIWNSNLWTVARSWGGNTKTRNTRLEIDFNRPWDVWHTKKENFSSRTWVGSLEPGKFSREWIVLLKWRLGGRQVGAPIVRWPVKKLACEKFCSSCHCVLLVSKTKKRFRKGRGRDTNRQATGWILQSKGFFFGFECGCCKVCAVVCGRLKYWQKLLLKATMVFEANLFFYLPFFRCR